MNRALRFEPLEVRRLLALTPLSGEFKINSTTDRDQGNPAVAADAEGGFVAVWDTSFEIGTGQADFEIAGRRFSSAGVPLGPDFRVNPTIPGDAFHADIAMEDGGGFVVVWKNLSTEQGHEILAQRFSPAGAALGDPILVAAPSVPGVGQVDTPAVAMDSTGGFVVTWSFNDFDGATASDIRARRFLADGTPAGGAIPVNNLVTSLHQEAPAIGMNADGRFVIAWHTFGGSSIAARQFDASAAPQGDEFLVNLDTEVDREFPSVAVGTDGRFVVVWQSPQEPSSSLFEIVGRRFDPLGAPVGGEFVANLMDISSIRPDVAMGPDGDFLVAWEDHNALTPAIVAREFAADGIPAERDFQVNSVTNDAERAPAIAFDGRGNVVVVWESVDPDPEALEIYGRRFSGEEVCTPHLNEFRANSTTVDHQFAPQVAVDPDGDFVIVWHSINQDGDSSGVYGQRFDAGGCPAGLEFQVNTTTAGTQFEADVAMDAAGNFVVVWTSENQDGDQLGVFGRAYTALGAPLGGEFQVNATSAGSQFFSSVARRPDGEFVVVWQSTNGDADVLGIVGRRFAADGTPLGGEFPVNTVTAGAQDLPDVAIDADGDFVVVWQSDGDGGPGYGIFGRRYNAAGMPQGSEFQVHSLAALDQRDPRVAMDSAGKFVVAWAKYPSMVFARQFDAAGVAQGDQFTVNELVAEEQPAPSVSMDADGDFFIAWTYAHPLGFEAEIVSRAYTPLGVAKGPESRLNDSRNGSQIESSVALDADGDIVSAWSGPGFGGGSDPSGIFARRFAAIPDPPPPPVLVTQSTTGFYQADPATLNSVFYLRNANSQGIADLTFSFGAVAPGIQALTGDWNGDDIDGIGLYLPIGGVYFLKNGNAAGAADHAYQFGPETDSLMALSGDWDDDGDVTVGLYNDRTGVFFLRNEHAAGPADVTVNFGAPSSGFRPLAGDWDGDGTDTIGLYHPDTGVFFLRNSLTPGAADLTYQYGPARGGAAIVGDWDADGDDTMGLWRRSDSAFFLKNEHAAGAADTTFNFGPNNTSWQPITGDWNGPSSPALRLADLAIRNSRAPSITVADARPLLDEALRRAGGVSPLFPTFPLFPAALLFSSPTITAPPTLRIADLPGNLLGLAVGNEIFIDHNAAGHGWLIDPTPAADEEYAPSNRRLLAIDRVLASDQVDLLTVIAHELGHLMGHDHADESDLMSATLGPGERKVEERN